MTYHNANTSHRRGEGRAPRGSRSGFYTATYLEGQGVEVRRIDGRLEMYERETAINFLEIEDTAEISTSNGKWMKRLERLGYLPENVDVFKGGGEIRVYSVPKRLIALPSDRRKKR